VIDNIFRLKRQDGISEWQIHARLQCVAGAIDLQVPHELTDGRRLLEEVINPLVSFVKDDHHFGIAPMGSRILQSMVPVGVLNRTKFQYFLLDLLREKENLYLDQICLAISLEDKSFELPEDYRNQVVFPVIQREELIEACHFSRGDWKAFLEQKAQRELSSYQRIGPKLNSFSSDERRKFFARAPLYKADLVISYFGDLSRFIKTSNPVVLSSLQFGVTATAGPARVLVCYADEAIIRGTTTRRGDSTVNWVQAAFAWGGKDAQ